MHKLLVFILAAMLTACGSTPSVIPKASTSTLEETVRTLPPKYLGDCPYRVRELMLENLIIETLQCWDPENGWMHFFSDNSYVRASSMIYLRLLPRSDRGRLVFVHMPKPYASGDSPPAEDQTFVLEASSAGQWTDVTKNVMPASVDLTSHFSPMRSQPVIEVAAYDKILRDDGKGYYYHFGKCTEELRWNGTQFELRSVPAHPLTEQSRL